MLLWPQAPTQVNKCQAFILSMSTIFNQSKLHMMHLANWNYENKYVQVMPTEILCSSQMWHLSWPSWKCNKMMHRKLLQKIDYKWRHCAIIHFGSLCRYNRTHKHHTDWTSQQFTKGLSLFLKTFVLRIFKKVYEPRRLLDPSPLLSQILYESEHLVFGFSHRTHCCQHPRMSYCHL